MEAGWLKRFDNSSKRFWAVCNFKSNMENPYELKNQATT
jgi:hypothetical protein